MRHQNSVFHSRTKLVPWSKFEQIVEKCGADRLVRQLTTKRHFIALLYGQLSGSTSLREIVTGMASHETRLYHVGAAPVKRSTMSDANSQRPWQVFSELFAQMLPQAHRGLRRATADAVRLIDSTSIRLSSLSGGWATFSADVFGAKAHIVYDPNADRPVYFAVTPAKVNDITAAKAMPIEPGATYVYDLGYYDYGWWARLDEAGCRFVTRLKKNTPLSVVKTNRVPKNSNIVSDHIGHLPARLANSRCKFPTRSRDLPGTNRASAAPGDRKRKTAPRPRRLRGSPSASSVRQRGRVGPIQTCARRSASVPCLRSQ